MASMARVEAGGVSSLSFLLSLLSCPSYHRIKYVVLLCCRTGM